MIPTLRNVVRRIPSATVSDLDDVVAMLAGEPGPVVVILDADNTLIRPGVDSPEFAETVNHAADRLEKIPSVARVIVVTNGPDRGVGRAVGDAYKPWTCRRRLDLGRRGDAAVWVVGDQVITDGVLAWRLRGRFIHLTLDPEDSYPGQARMRRVGRFIAPLFLRREG